MRRLMLWVLVLTLSVASLPSLGVASAQEPAISIAIPSLWADIMDMDAMIAEFEAQYGVRVEVRYQDNFFGGPGGDAESTLASAATLAESADVVYVDSSTLNILGTRAGYFLDLAPLVGGDATLNPDDFYASVWQSFQWDNSIWAVPISANLFMVTYLPSAFDEAGLAHPDANWTLEDYFYAAEQLTEYDSAGGVFIPGIMAGFNGSEYGWLVRGSLGHGFYNAEGQPDFSNPDLATLLERWLELTDEGVIGIDFNENFDQVPIRFGGGLTVGFASAGGPGGAPEDPTAQVVLPGGVAGLDTQAFAISSGTAYPELAYELVKFLSTRPDVGRNFFGVTPARRSLQGVTVEAPEDGPRFFNGNASPEIQAIIDADLVATLPSSENRFAEYLGNAFAEMQDGSDAQTALQNATASALDDLQLAADSKASTMVNVIPPEEEVVLASGEIALNVGVNLSSGGGAIRIAGGGANELPNQAEWDAVNQEFIANDGQVGDIQIESANGSLAEMLEQYECFITASNQVAGNDLSGLLSLDPFLDADPNFRRDDVVGTTLTQLQSDNRTWAYPIAIQPQFLRYNTELFEQMGLNLPTNGWTAEEFADALEQLDGMSEGASFVPNDPSGSYILKLIAAFGGLPVDYRTSPPTINFSDPNTIAAIRQVLDLAKAGYIDYSGLGTREMVISINSDQTAPISTDQLFGIPLPPGMEQQADLTSVTTYPHGSQYGVLSYDITAGYISANAQNPEACYRWLQSVAQNPQLFSGIPARASVAQDPNIASQLDPGAAEILPEVARLMNDPNTLIFPNFFGSAGGPALTHWLYQAFDNYVLEDGDLEADLAEAQLLTQSYQECAAGVVPDPNNPFAAFQQYEECAVLVDPNYMN